MKPEMQNQSEIRLDAAETAFFMRELESIDATIYENVYPQYKARSLIATQSGVDPDAHVYTYRMFNRTGKARPIGNGADDAPPGNVTGAEFSQRIQNIGDFYKWNIFELKAAAKTGTPLDRMRADSCRQAIEELVDEYLAVGNTTLGLKGLLKLSNTSSVTSAGFWGTLATADPDKIIADILQTAAKGSQATDQAFQRFTLVMPQAMFDLASQLKVSDLGTTTVLQYCKQVSPYIEDVQPWFRCEAGQTTPAIDSTHDMLCAFPKDMRVVSALVPREMQFLEPEKRNYEYIVNAHASVGGVVCRYPKAITYCSVPTS